VANDREAQAEAFEEALAPLLQVLQDIQASTRTTASSTQARFGANRSSTAMAPGMMGSHPFAGPAQASAGRKIFGVRGARAMGYRLPMFLPGKAGAMGAAAGGMAGSAVNAAAGVISSTAMNFAGSFARAGFEFGFKVPLTGRGVARVTGAVDAAANRLAGISGMVARGEGKMSTEQEGMLMEMFTRQELGAASARKRADALAHKWKANIARAPWMSSAELNGTFSASSRESLAHLFDSGS